MKGPRPALSHSLPRTLPRRHCWCFHFQDGETAPWQRLPARGGPAPEQWSRAGHGTRLQGQTPPGGRPRAGRGAGRWRRAGQLCLSKPGFLHCRQPPRPGRARLCSARVERFPLLLPRAASCLPFELGCWLPSTRPPRSAVLWPVPMLEVPRGPHFSVAPCSSAPPGRPALGAASLCAPALPPLPAPAALLGSLCPGQRGFLPVTPTL